MGHKLFDIILLLEQGRTHRGFFTLNRYQEDAVTICVTYVGERLEISVFEDGHVEFSRFIGDESVEADEVMLRRIISDNAD